MRRKDIIRLLPWIAAAALAAPGPLPAAQAADTVQLQGAPTDAKATLDRARQLLTAGRANEAYALLAPREFDWSGASEFDYLFGIAALDTGKPADAVFSLERVLAAQPDFDGARMELARAQFEAGDFAAARSQFQYLASRSPPADTGRVIDRYIEAIDARAGSRQQRWSGFVETGGGYDSNANASTSSTTFGGYFLDPDNVETGSGYVSVAGGINHSTGFANGLASTSGLRLDYRNNPDAHFVDQAVASGGSSLYWNAGAWRMSGGVNGFYGLLDGDPNESYLGLNAGIGRLFGEDWEIGGRLQGGALRYHQDALETLDVDRYVGTLTLTRYNIGTAGARLSMSLVGGRDDATEDGSLYGNDKLGGRIAGNWPVRDNIGLYMEAGYLRSDYDDGAGFYDGSGLSHRNDDQYTALVSADLDNWPAAGWTLSPHVRYVRNDSSISLYEYDRWEAGVNLSRNFQ